MTLHGGVRNRSLKEISKKAKQLAIRDKNPNRPAKRFDSKNFVDNKELEKKRIEAKGLAPKYDTTNLYSVLDNRLWVENCSGFEKVMMKMIT